ncbi:MAG: hypothetical protein II085_00015, partial [Alphaproteobacteria bacterium]|nr:hypothetical protein [Alphaproteobacteria bacterium]
LVGLTKGKIKVNSITKAVKDCAPPVKGVIKESIKQASFLGGGLGAIVGLFCPAIMAEKADKQVTNEFIERNK